MTSLVPSKVASFVTKFYEISDKPGAHVEYADCFVDDAACNFSGVSHPLREGIIKMREEMWVKIAKRVHHPKRVYVNADASECVVWGSAEFIQREGDPFSTTFFGRLTFADPGAEELLMSHYEMVLRQMP